MLIHDLVRSIKVGERSLKLESDKFEFKTMIVRLLSFLTGKFHPKPKAISIYFSIKCILTENRVSYYQSFTTRSFSAQYGKIFG